jgi:N-acetylglucosamine-6-sulfatase
MTAACLRAPDLTRPMPARSHKRIALGALVLLAATATALPSAHAQSGPAAAHRGELKPPNIVVIQADDETYAQLNHEVMPNTERLLVKKGTTFTNYIATTAQCCPSRASFFTGQYAHNHGVTSNRVGYPGLVDKGNVLPVWLKRAGYNTIHLGKFMNNYERFAKPESTVAPGWEQWHTVLSEAQYYDYDLFVNGRTTHYGRAPKDNLTTVLNHDAVRMVNRYAPKRKPFYLQLDERSPHVTHQFDPHGSCGHAAIPEPQDEGRFKDPLPKPPSFNERDMSDKPSFLRSAPRLNVEQRNNLHRRWKCSLDAIAGVDRGVKKVFNAVQDSGEIRRTVFLFVSDNGFFFGEHRLAAGKVFPYEEALHLPLVIRVPRRYRADAPRVDQTPEPTANIDIAPTLTQLAGASPCNPNVGCRTMDGRSLVPLLEGTGRWPSNRGLLTEYQEPGLGRHSTCQFAGIRQDAQLYVEHYRVVEPGGTGCVDENPPLVERYNLTTDPYELNNMCFGGLLANCPTTPQQLLLKQGLARLKDCAGIKGRDQPVDGRPFCE